jgi:hypothetical protein
MANTKIIGCGKSDETDELRVYKDGQPLPDATPEKGREFKCGDPIAGDYLVLCNDCAVRHGFKW